MRRSSLLLIGVLSVIITITSLHFAFGRSWNYYGRGYNCYDHRYNDRDRLQKQRQRHADSSTANY